MCAGHGPVWLKQLLRPAWASQPCALSCSVKVLSSESEMSVNM